MTQLKRSIGPVLLTAYGMGVMIGAGIYVLVGGVAAAAGMWAPVAFLLAGLVAAPTALSYAELSSRIPEAGGEASYVAEAFAPRWLPVLIGVAIVVAGTVSGAAVLRGGVGYLTAIVPVPAVLAILGIGAALTAVAAKGALESLALAALFTAVEVIGLGLVIWAGWSAPAPATVEAGAIPILGIASAAALAFFAFIGFEDIVNMAEEVRRPERSVPLAILVSLLLTTVIYALVTWAALRAVPPDALAQSARPLALVWQAGTGGTGAFLSGIAVLAALNGVLAQMVMAARVLYGLGQRSRVFAPFHAVHPRTGTPLRATLLVGAAAIMAALILPVSVLAELTSAVLLSVFIFINIALLRLKARAPAAPFRVPVYVPWAGALLSAVALCAALLERFAA